MQNPADQSQNSLIDPNNKPDAHLFKTTGEFSSSVTQPETPKSQEPAPPQEKQVVTEIFKSPETLPNPPQQPMPTAAQTAKQIIASENSQATNIVDQTSEDITLHPIKKAVDKLTTIADLEEEQFIKEVEAAHEHQ